MKVWASHLIDPLRPPDDLKCIFTYVRHDMRTSPYLEHPDDQGKIYGLTILLCM